MLYDDYHEKHYTDSEASELLERYLKWCELNNQKPEVESTEQLTENNIGHVAYHANMI